MKRLTTWCAAGALAFFGAALAQNAAVAGEDNHPLKSFLKTAPKAPDAWCQRDAMQRAAVRAKIVMSEGAAPGKTGNTGEPEPKPVAATPDSCNPDYSARLDACVAGLVAVQGAAAGEGGISTRIRDCMSRLAASGIRAAR